MLVYTEMKGRKCAHRAGGDEVGGVGILVENGVGGKWVREGVCGGELSGNVKKSGKMTSGWEI